MKKKRSGLSSIVYTEWIRPVVDYYSIIEKNEFIFEIFMPFTIALICSLVYYKHILINKALIAMGGLLPTAISVLIGFTIMLITLLLTSSGEGIEKIKKSYTDKQLNQKKVSLYQALHIQFIHLLFSEILLLLIVFLFFFFKGLGMEKGQFMILFFEIYLTLNVLLSVIRGITNLYYSFYNN